MIETESKSVEELEQLYQEGLIKLGDGLDRSLAAAVVRHEIIDNDLGIGRPDRRPECRDHLVHLGLPTLAVEKRRVHGQIIERVAGVAIVFNDAPTGPGLECDVLLSLGAYREKHALGDWVKLSNRA